GLALGHAVGAGLVQLVTRTVNDMYFQVDVEGLGVEPWVLARGVALGLLGTLAAALVPALEATRQAPRSALASSHLESDRRTRAPWAALAGVLLLVASLALLHLGPALLAISFMALFGLLAGAALCAPLVTLGLARVATPVLGGLAGSTGRIAARGVARHLSRNGVAVGALAVAVAATLGIGLLIGSFRTTVEDWLGLTLAADVYVSAPSDVASRNHADLPPGLVESLRARPDVRAVTTYRGFEARDTAGGLVFAAALDLGEVGHVAYDFVGAPPADLEARWRDGALLVSEPLARRRGLGPGDRLELVTDAGPRRFEVLAVYRDYSNDQGFALLSRATYEAHFADRGVSSASLYLRPGSEPERVVDELYAARPDNQLYFVRSQAALRATSLSIFDRTFRVTGVLRLFSGAVAFVAILSALLALQFEREREIGVLRALGMTPRGVRGLVVLETGLLGCAAGLCALPLGAALCWLLAEHVNVRAFGWTISTHFPPAPFVEAFALALGAALLAALLPAWRLSRGSPGRSLWNE
ncbi:MAG TPA: ABC transporter permease, partial [Planctomycetota bacterium]|nr:ABC transporter permease [Planctomycetota bacterium]